jgi:hypothetical protein
LLEQAEPRIRATMWMAPLPAAEQEALPTATMPAARKLWNQRRARTVAAVVACRRDVPPGLRSPARQCWLRGSSFVVVSANGSDQLRSAAPKASTTE